MDSASIFACSDASYGSRLTHDSPRPSPRPDRDRLVGSELPGHSRRPGSFPAILLRSAAISDHRDSGGHLRAASTGAAPLAAALRIRFRIRPVRLPLLGDAFGDATGLASLVLQSSAPFTVLLGAFLLREKLSVWQVSGIAVAVGGMSLIGWDRSHHAHCCPSSSRSSAACPGRSAISAAAWLRQTPSASLHRCA